MKALSLTGSGEKFWPEWLLTRGVESPEWRAGLVGDRPRRCCRPAHHRVPRYITVRT